MCSACATRASSVFVGHKAENLGEAEVVVVSTAIKQDNPELMAAREKLLPIVRRAEMLAELMRFRQAVAIGGTHGKTTTTSMVATLLDAGGLDPTVINGGIINAYGTNARMGEGEWMVVEADESDGTFLKLPADIAVVTNIDPEHLDHYGSFDAVREAFRQFVENVPFYGFAVMCIDHPEVQALVGAHRGPARSSPMAKTRRPMCASRRSASTARRRCSTSSIRDRTTGTGSSIDGPAPADAGPPQRARTRLPRSRSPTNSASRPTTSARGLPSFGGVKRRFTRTGDWNGVADLRRLRPPSGRDQGRAEGRARHRPRAASSPIAQPHRYTRLHDLFEDFSTCFNDADTVIVAPVYAAGEEPIDGVNSEELVAAHQRRRPPRRALRRRAGAIAPLVRELAKPGDFVVFLGGRQHHPMGLRACRGNWRLGDGAAA